MRTLTTSLLLLIAHTSFAEEPSCTTTTTTTTTTHCTGSAAPYAAPPAPGAELQPVPELDPRYAPPPPPGPSLRAPVLLLDRRMLERDDWRIKIETDGSIWRERRSSTTSGSLLAAGVATFVGAWLVNAVATASQENRYDSIGVLGLFPVLGAWGNAAAADGYSQHNAQMLYLLDGAVQAAGFIMLLVSTGAGPQKVERERVNLSGMILPGGAGVSAAGMF